MLFSDYNRAVNVGLSKWKSSLVRENEYLLSWQLN